MLEIQSERVKIDFYKGSGIVITIKERNTTVIKEYATPCFLKYNEKLIELHEEYLVDHSTMNYRTYEGEAFKRLLPQLLEHGEMLEKDESPRGLEQ